MFPYNPQKRGKGGTEHGAFSKQSSGKVFASFLKICCSKVGDLRISIFLNSSYLFYLLIFRNAESKPPCPKIPIMILWVYHWVKITRDWCKNLYLTKWTRQNGVSQLPSKEIAITMIPAGDWPAARAPAPPPAMVTATSLTAGCPELEREGAGSEGMLRKAEDGPPKRAPLSVGPIVARQPRLWPRGQCRRPGTRPASRQLSVASLRGSAAQADDRPRAR